MTKSAPRKLKCASGSAVNQSCDLPMRRRKFSQWPELCSGDDVEVDGDFVFDFDRAACR